MRISDWSSDVCSSDLKFARPASLLLSLDLVEMLLAADNRADVVLYLVGREELKGVMFGRPYPIIWMHEAGEGFDFMPWEVETCPHIAAAVDARPASVEALQIGRAHVCTPVTNEHPVCRILHEQ